MDLHVLGENCVPNDVAQECYCNNGPNFFSYTLMIHTHLMITAFRSCDVGAMCHPDTRLNVTFPKDMWNKVITLQWTSSFISLFVISWQQLLLKIVKALWLGDFPWLGVCLFSCYRFLWYSIKWIMMSSFLKFSTHPFLPSWQPSVTIVKVWEMRTR